MKSINDDTITVEGGDSIGPEEIDVAAAYIVKQLSKKAHNIKRVSVSVSGNGALMDEAHKDMIETYDIVVDDIKANRPKKLKLIF